ncbi:MULTISPECIES: hypothetical protein [unclassified Devosia]|uniref:hypothetical protein n=1 Tax=unclassified Devosia TaxID=196773 RepID=UPI00145C49D6|nr:MULTISPECIES: hypothetical protein [unclassified Devosia]MBJ6987031.1 hypothetical protein [Devosia sp. MC521]MBJ7576595.1 hypothetical protein [Devosia sp. MC532]QMW64049.1 hypothetical protein H4N61_07000 [Devosia sp. MC521]
MTKTFIAKIALVSTLLIIPVTAAQAYVIHSVNGKNWVTCDNGQNWSMNGGTTPITHVQAARGCAKFVSTIAAPPAEPTEPGERADEAAKSTTK